MAIAETAAGFMLELLRHGQETAKREALDEQPRRPLLRPNKDFTSQGDINIWLVDSLDKLPLLEECDPFYQLAPGTSKGSRHCLDKKSVANATFYRIKRGNVLQGPVWVNPEPTLITHPEHKHQILDSGIYFVTYQRRYADEVARVID